MKKKESSKAAAVPVVKASHNKKTKVLSPAKKFRLRLRRAKFQKQKQSKDEYFEHDNRGAAKASMAKKKMSRLAKKGRQAQMYIDAYLKSQHMTQNGDAASQDETQDSSNGNEVSMKSIVQRTNAGLPPMTSQLSHAFGKEQAIHRALSMKSTFPPVAGSVSTSKCCCHCACSEKRKKPRRKLSSPYFGDFNRPVSFARGSCVQEAAEVTTKILNKTMTTTHQATLVKSSDFVNFNPLSKVAMKQSLLFDGNLQGRAGSGGGCCGMKEVRSVMRFVLCFFHKKELGQREISGDNVRFPFRDR